MNLQQCLANMQLDYCRYLELQTPGLSLNSRSLLAALAAPQMTDLMPLLAL